MPKMPVVAKMPNGKLRLVLADADTELALKFYPKIKAYIVEIKTEEEFDKLKQGLCELNRKLNETN